MAITYWGRK